VRKEEFIHALREELIRQGISEETARQYVLAIEESLGDSDLREIEQMQDTDEIGKLARGIILFRKHTDKEEKQSASPSPSDTVNGGGEKENEAEILSDDEDGSSDGEEQYDSDDDVKIFTGTFPPPPSTVPEKADFTEKEYEEIIHDDDFLQQEATPRGKRIFWGVFIGTMPLTLLLLAAYFLLFGGLFGALCALIVVLVAGLIALVAAGTAISLVGIVYGITQLISVSSAAPGLYEIGLGVTVGGAVMLAGILLYNLAIRLLPFVIRHLVFLFRICGDKLRGLFHRAKEACYRL